VVFKFFGDVADHRREAASIPGWPLKDKIQVAIKIRLLQGETLMVDVDAETWIRAFQAAVRDGGMIQARNDEGRILGINPGQVAYLEELAPSGESNTASPAGAGISGSPSNGLV
jgi:hypothetical protein